MLKKTQSKFPKVLQGWLGHRKIEEIECVISDMAGVVRGKAMPLSKFEKLENVYMPLSKQSQYVHTCTCLRFATLLCCIC